MDELLFEKRLQDFTPEPLVPPTKDFYEVPMVKEDSNNIDLAKVNFLDLLNNEEIKHASEHLIREYGVGTCGPRAFYGTTDVHLELEEKLAEFLNVEETIVYSYGFVAISSAIAAYCKKSDVIFVDEKANFAIEQGLVAARSKIVRFKHNSAADFRAKVSELVGGEKKRVARKFLIVEGVSWETGKLCPLPDFLVVAEEFKIRVFLDESYTLGVFGETGRGLLEYYQLEPSKIDMSFGTLEGAVGSIGGFCAGTKLIIEHQRLSGSGYIFSASLPTYLVNVVLKSLTLLGENPGKLRRFAKDFHSFLVENCQLEVISHPEAPFKVFLLDSREKEQKFYDYCKSEGVHFIKKEQGLLINLNLALVDDKDRLERVKTVLKAAKELVN